MTTGRTDSNEPVKQIFELNQVNSETSISETGKKLQVHGHKISVPPSAQPQPIAQSAKQVAQQILSAPTTENLAAHIPLFDAQKKTLNMSKENIPIDPHVQNNAHKTQDAVTSFFQPEVAEENLTVIHGSTPNNKEATDPFAALYDDLDLPEGIDEQAAILSGNSESTPYSEIDFSQENEQKNASSETLQAPSAIIDQGSATETRKIDQADMGVDNQSKEITSESNPSEIPLIYASASDYNNLTARIKEGKAKLKDARDGQVVEDSQEAKNNKFLVIHDEETNTVYASNKEALSHLNQSTPWLQGPNKPKGILFNEEQFTSLTQQIIAQIQAAKENKTEEKRHTGDTTQDKTAQKQAKLKVTSRQEIEPTTQTTAYSALATAMILKELAKSIEKMARAEILEKEREQESENRADDLRSRHKKSDQEKEDLKEETLKFNELKSELQQRVIKQEQGIPPEFNINFEKAVQHLQNNIQNKINKELTQ